jgi:hypothetical protein
LKLLFIKEGYKYKDKVLKLEFFPGGMPSQVSQVIKTSIVFFLLI